MDRPEIRAVTPSDVEALYDICLRTGAAGADATGMYEDSRLLGSIYVGPYVMLPGSIGFVALDRTGLPAGYVLATADTPAFELRCESDWWPHLRQRYIDPGAPSTPDERLMHLIHHPPTANPVVTAAYPAHLHIDLLPTLQGTGTGRRLMEAALTALAAEGASGIHLGVDPANTNARNFYLHLGFGPLTHLDEPEVMGKKIPGTP